MRLGDLLVHEHIITNEQLMQALNSQKSTGRKLGDTLIELGHIGERQLLEFLAQQLDVPFLDISQRRIPAEVAGILPEVHARRLRALVIESDSESVLIGMSDPADLGGLDQLESMFSPKKLKLAVVMESQLFEAFDGIYRRTADIESFASQLEEEYEETLFGKLHYLLESEAYDYHIQIQEASPEIKSQLKTPARIIELWEN